jgi:23S rRNA (cytidine1920-2'-O)/16S rRNA (cytidine1409-2'-O)-methyltransferase
VLGGKVWVGGHPADKPGRPVDPNLTLELRGGIPYVSRGGIKLEHALRSFGIDVAGLVVLDVGASTGGFTDCVLQAGAARVYSIDVGYGQLAWRLRGDPRVVAIERRNIRYLRREELDELADLAVIDVSFISLTLVLPKVLQLIKQNGQIVALVKPQFEVGRQLVGKGGVVRDPEKHQSVVGKIRKSAEALGLETRGVTESPILGPKGNREFFLHLSCGARRDVFFD